MDIQEPQPHPATAPTTQEQPATTAQEPAVSRAQLDELYARHHGFVRRVLARLGVPPANLEDATQDVFVVLTRKIEDYDPRYNVMSWLWGMSRKVAKRYRDARTHVELQEDYAEKSQVAAGDWASRLHARRLVDEFLDGQDGEAMQVFVLSELLGHTAREIAAQLDLPLTTVQWRIRVVRDKFAGLLARNRLTEQRQGFLGLLFGPWFGGPRARPAMGSAGSATVARLLTFLVLAIAVTAAVIAGRSWQTSGDERVHNLEPASLARSAPAAASSSASQLFGEASPSNEDSDSRVATSATFAIRGRLVPDDDVKLVDLAAWNVLAFKASLTPDLLSAKVNARGEFVFEGLSPGSFLLQLDGGLFEVLGMQLPVSSAGTSVEITDRDVEISLQLRKPRTLEVWVADADKNPVANITVMGHSPLTDGFTTASCETNQQGYCQILHIGADRLTEVRPLGINMPAQEVDLNAEKTLRFVLPKNLGEIRGTLTNLGDVQPRALRAVLRNLDDQDDSGFPDETDVDEHGQFLFPNLQAGDYTIEIYTRGTLEQPESEKQSTLDWYKQHGAVPEICAPVVQHALNPASTDMPSTQQKQACVAALATAPRPIMTPEDNPLNMHDFDLQTMVDQIQGKEVPMTAVKVTVDPERTKLQTITVLLP